MTSEKSYDSAQRLDALVTALVTTDPGGWTNVGRLNGWAVITGTSQPSPAVTFIDYANRFVLYQGALATGTVADTTVVGNIPAPYRPKNAKVTINLGTNGGAPTPTEMAYFEIQLNGDVQTFGVKAAMLSVRWSAIYAIDAPAA